MSAARDSSSVGQTIKGIAVRDAVGLKTILSAYGRDAAAALKTIFSGFKVVVSPNTASGYVNSPGTFSAITGGVYGTVTGGSGSYTYAWTVGTGWTALSPTSIGTAFRSPALSPGDESEEFGYLTVTDTVTSATTVSDNITLYATNVHF